jgi:CRP/FNR family transcriptional regulator
MVGYTAERTQIDVARRPIRGHRRSPLDGRAVLGHYRFYREAPPVLQEVMAPSGRVASSPPGSHLLDAGGTCEHVVLLAAGNIRVFIPSNTGREVTLYHVRPGELCPLNLLCVMLGTRSPAIARAEARLDVLLVPREVFRDWVERYSVLRDFAFQVMATRLVEVVTQVEQVTFQRMDRRLAEYLLTRFDSQSVPRAAVSVTHEQVAMDLGSAREVVSRLLKDFERRGAVELGRGRLMLRDADVLRGIVDHCGAVSQQE